MLRHPAATEGRDEEMYCLFRFFRVVTNQLEGKVTSVFWRETLKVEMISFNFILMELRSKLCSQDDKMITHCGVCPKALCMHWGHTCPGYCAPQRQAVAAGVI